jgi:hypothetical protein
VRLLPVCLALLVSTAPVMAETLPAPTLVGVARIPSNTRDQFGETLGGFGSAMALVPGSWRHTGNQYTATLTMLPDRGWNTQGTTDYRARLQHFALTLIPYGGRQPVGQTGLSLVYKDSLLLRDAEGTPTTGLDATAVRPAAKGFPDLPVAANRHVSVDGEGLVLPGDGTAWISDEYGPYLYHFDRAGKMIGAIRPPDAFVPMRKQAGGLAENFSADSPPAGQKKGLGEPVSGRQNNQGFEGLAISPDHKTLFAILQSAAMQDTNPGDIKTTRRYTRLVAYDISGTPKLLHEYVVPLPLYGDGDRKLVAAQSEMLALDDHRLLLLCRDSGAGFTGKKDASAYRRVELVDLSAASDIAGGKYDKVGGSVAPMGVLDSAIIPARLGDVLDINNNAELARFGLHNGPPNDTNDLYEKWESMALAPVGDAPDDYFLLIGSDNDFITQDGMMAGEPYKDASGADVDTLVMAWRITIPKTGR